MEKRTQHETEMQDNQAGDNRGKMVMVKNQHGASVLTVVFVMLVLTAIGYTLAAMMVAKQRSVPATLEAGSAFYLAEAGIHYTGKYLSDLADWSTVSDQTKNLGGGSFTVSFSDYSSGSPESIIATSTGTYGTGERVVKATFER